MSGAPSSKGIFMSRIALVLFATASIAAPLAVQAQVTGYGGGRPQDYSYNSPDRNYCAPLADLYARYVGRSETGPHTNRRPDVDGGVALAKCQQGDTAAAIPILERKLIDAKVTLPP